MRKIKILALTLVLVMLLSTVVACGSNTSQGEKDTSSEAITQSSNEETKAPEPTTAAQSTTVEATTSNKNISSSSASIDYSKYTISEETKKMLIEKLTNLELIKGQKFDLYSLPFKEDEKKTCYLLESKLAYSMFSPINGTGVLECCVENFRITKCIDEENYFRIYIEIIY